MQSNQTIMKRQRTKLHDVEVRVPDFDLNAMMLIGPSELDKHQTADLALADVGHCLWLAHIRKEAAHYNELIETIV